MLRRNIPPRPNTRSSRRNSPAAPTNRNYRSSQIPPSSRGMPASRSTPPSYQGQQRRTAAPPSSQTNRAQFNKRASTANTPQQKKGGFFSSVASGIGRAAGAAKDAAVSSPIGQAIAKSPVGQAIANSPIGQAIANSPIGQGVTKQSAGAKQASAAKQSAEVITEKPKEEQKGFFSKIGEGISKFGNAAKEVVSETVSNVLEKGKEGVQDAIGKGAEAFDRSKNALVTMLENGKDGVKDLFHKGAAVVDGTKELLGNVLERGREGAKSLLDQGSAVVDGTKELLGDIFAAGKEGVKDLMSKGSAVVEGTKALLEESGKSVLQAGGKVAEGLAEFFEGEYDGMKRIREPSVFSNLMSFRNPDSSTTHSSPFTDEDRSNLRQGTLDNLGNRLDALPSQGTNKVKKELGPVVSGLYDADLAKIDGNTGYYYNINGKWGEVPENLHPTLSARKESMNDDANSYEKGKAGSHAEIYNVNQALHARDSAGLPSDEKALNRMMLDAVSTQKNGKYIPEAGTPVPRCPHCQSITNGVEYLNLNKDIEMNETLKIDPAGNQNYAEERAALEAKAKAQEQAKKRIQINNNGLAINPGMTVNEDPNTYLYRKNLFDAKAETDALYNANAAVSGDYGSASANIDFMKAQATGNADFAVKKDGVRLESDFEAGYYLAKGQANAETNIGGVDFHAGASGDIGPSVKGSADFALGRVDGKLQAGLDAEIGAYLAKGEVSGGFKVFGIDVTGRAQGKIGAGAEAGIGLKDGKLSLNLGATLGIGGSVGVEIDCSELISNVGNTISNVKDSVGGAVNNFGNWLGGIF